LNPVVVGALSYFQNTLKSLVGAHFPPRNKDAKLAVFRAQFP
jgi:hypothetical protein